MKNLIIETDPKSPVAEAYRTLRTNIQFSNIDKNIKSIVVTSPSAGEGKSTTISNLAVAFARTGKKVIVIDSDFRKSRIHKQFGIAGERGITNCLVNGHSYKEYVVHTSIDNLHIMPAGPTPPNPAELIGSRMMGQMIDSMKNDYDMVFVDAPPVGLVTDAALLSSMCEAVIMVCAVGHSDIKAVEHSKELLDNVKANILGVVMNKIPVNDTGYYKYHYYNYYTNYSNEGEAKKPGLLSRVFGGK